MERNFFVDALKVFLALMVVAIHCGFLKESPLLGFLTTQGIFRIAVPIFFVINGYYFGSVKNTESLFTWLKKVLRLYLFWGTVYASFWFHLDDLSITQFLTLVKEVIFGYFHLWYLPGMIGAGLLTFLFRERVKLGSYIATVCFFVGVVIQYSANYYDFESDIMNQVAAQTFTHRNFLFLGFPFFYFGFVLTNLRLHILTKNTVVIAAAGATLLMIESYLNFSQDSHNAFDNYFSLIFVCPTLFLFFLKRNIKKGNKYIALTSTGIYFTHPLFLLVLVKLGFDTGTIFTLLVLALSLSSTFFLIMMKEKFKINFIL